MGSIGVGVFLPAYVVRTGLQTMLSGSEMDVAVAADLTDVVTTVSQHQPELTILPFPGPGCGDLDLFAVMEDLQLSVPNTSVVVFAEHENPTYVVRAQAYGVKDIISMETDRETLVERLTRVAQGAPNLVSVAKTVKLRAAKVHGDFKPVTKRELEVWQLIAYALSNREIAKVLEISVETVKEHVQNLLRKINAVDRTQAAVFGLKRELIP